MLKNEIDKIALAMIEQTKQYEASFEKNLKKKCDTIQTQFCKQWHECDDTI